jgi:recombination protein RecR
MIDLVEPLSNLINELKKLPGIGEKTALRLSFHILHSSKDDIENLARSIMNIKDKITLCSICFNITDSDPCNICIDKGRDDSIICVVETPQDLFAIEKTKNYRGKYHVLHGSISPLDGVNPDSLKIKELLERVKNGDIKEVILATNPNVEGEATAVYISRLIKPFGVKTSRIAKGVPVGSDLEYIDEVTLSGAIDGRREI